MVEQLQPQARMILLGPVEIAHEPAEPGLHHLGHRQAQAARGGFLQRIVDILELQARRAAGGEIPRGHPLAMLLEDGGIRETAPQRIADRGVAVLLVRLRGYPGSHTTCGDLIDLNEHGNTWITRGFDEESHEEWILPKGVADVCNACRVMRNALLHRDTDTDIPVDDSIQHPGVYLHGSSLGGGLAVICAAQLIGKLRGESIVDRLAIAMPSLGDWTTRLHDATGTAMQFKRVIEANPDRREELLARLKICDAIVHGRKVHVPTFGMLARKDLVVPPHCAAAVFNSIDADPGRKWRFLIDHGHHDGDRATNRRIALYRRALCDFFDPDQAPIRSLDPWECLMHDGDRAPDGMEIKDDE